MSKRKTNKKTLWIAILILALLVLSIFLAVYLTRKGNDYIVKFDTGEGVLLSFDTKHSGGRIVKPADPEKEGYVFEGWFNGDEEFDFDEKLLSDIVLKAKWRKLDVETNVSYTIEFDSAGGSAVDAVEVNDDGTVIKPADPKRAGYTFDGWKLDGETFDFAEKITKDIRLVASWTQEQTSTPAPAPQTPKENTTKTPTAPIKHTITFNSNGGTAVRTLYVVKGTVPTRPANPTRSGYTFAGWYLNGVLYGFNKGLYDNITLVAKWNPVQVIDKYTVAYEQFQMGSPQVKVYVKKNGVTVGASAVLTSDGKIIGTYNSEFKVILVDQTDYSKIAKARLSDNTVVTVSR